MFRKMLANALAVRRPHLRLVSTREKERERERYFDIPEVRAPGKSVRPGTESHNSAVAPGFISDRSNQRRIFTVFSRTKNLLLRRFDKIVSINAR